MSKPTSQEIASAMGVNLNQVHALHKRGMPINKIKKAREWFDANGFDRVSHGKSGGASSGGGRLETMINAARGTGRGVLPVTK